MLHIWWVGNLTETMPTLANLSNCGCWHGHVLLQMLVMHPCARCQIGPQAVLRFAVVNSRSVAKRTQVTVQNTPRQLHCLQTSWVFPKWSCQILSNRIYLLYTLLSPLYLILKFTLKLAWNKTVQPFTHLSHSPEANKCVKVQCNANTMCQSTAWSYTCKRKANSGLLQQIRVAADAILILMSEIKERSAILNQRSMVSSQKSLLPPDLARWILTAYGATSWPAGKARSLMQC